MRTSIDIDDQLLALAKKKAIEQNSSLKKVVEAALRQSLLKPYPRKEQFRLNWKTIRGRLVPGIDFSDRDALYERMEGRS
jgi:Arc/MetJ family transcription regulator